MIKLAPIAKQILTGRTVTLKITLTANERGQIKQLLLANERNKAKDRLKQLLVEKVGTAQ